MPKNLDSNIFWKVKNGDEEAFNIIYHSFYSQLCFFCDSYVKDMDLSRSLVQQVYVDIWIKREKIRISNSIKSYLYNAVKNKAIDHLRQLKNNLPISPEIENLQSLPFKDHVQESETLGQINQAINALPYKCREIFLLCKFEGLKYKEIAQKLNISIKTVEMQMGIALKKLRNKLTDNKTLKLFVIFFNKKIRVSYRVFSRLSVMV